MTSINELLVGYKFCGETNLPEEAKKLKKIINAYLDNTLADLDSKTKAVDCEAEVVKEDTPV